MLQIHKTIQSLLSNSVVGLECHFRQGEIQNAGNNEGKRRDKF